MPIQHQSMTTAAAHQTNEWYKEKRTTNNSTSNIKISVSSNNEYS